VRAFRAQRASEQKGGVVHLQLSRGHCIAFWPSVPPLQVAPSFACSVASLSRSPGLQLPGCHSLHCGILADYLLGWGRPSTCSTGHAEFQSTSSPSPHWATGDWVLPANCKQANRVQGGTGSAESHEIKPLSHTLMLRLCIWGGGARDSLAYLLGLLAMIKCSICSYQCDN